MRIPQVRLTWPAWTAALIAIWLGAVAEAGDDADRWRTGETPQIERTGVFAYTIDGEPSEWHEVKPWLQRKSSTQRLLRGQEAGLWVGSIGLGALTGYTVVGGIAAAAIREQPSMLGTSAAGLLLLGPPSVVLGIFATRHRRKAVRLWTAQSRDGETGRPRSPIVVPGGPGRFSLDGHPLPWTDLRVRLARHPPSADALATKRMWTSLGVATSVIGLGFTGLGTGLLVAYNEGMLGGLLAGLGGVLVFESVLDYIWAHQAKMRAIDRYNEAVESGEIDAMAAHRVPRHHRVRLGVAPWVSQGTMLGVVVGGRF